MSTSTSQTATSDDASLSSVLDSETESLAGAFDGRRRGVRIEHVALALRMMFIALVLGGLELAVAREWINPLFVARPSVTVEVLIDRLMSGEYVKLIGVTLYETAAAFLLVAFFGLLFGYLLWRVRDLGRAFDPLLMGLFASPIILLYPVFLIIFGRTSQAVIVLAALGGVIPTLIATKQALDEVSPTFLKASRLLCRSRYQSVRAVLIPAATPGIVSGLVLGFTYTILNVLAVEFLANTGGLGGEISGASSRLRADEMYASLTLVILLTAAFIWGLKMVDRSFSKKVVR